MSLRVDERAEWLEWDALGGFASGTVNGIRTRRYHALLLAATTPPSGRVVLVNGVEAWIETPSDATAITSQCYAPDVIHPDCAKRIDSFESEPWPRWEYLLEDGARIRHEIFVTSGAPVAVLTWKPTSRRKGLTLNVRPLFSGRDPHALHHENPG